MNQNNVTTIGIDTAKNVFHLYAVDKHGKQVYQRKLGRSQLLEFLANHPASLIAIESCSGSYHWAREFKKLGHSVKIISARHVKKYANTRNKNDFNDAKAIVKAALDPDIPEVAHKSMVQQEIQAVHTIRDGLIRQRTATINRLRALLTEFGIVLPVGREKLMKLIPHIYENADNKLTDIVRQIVNEQYDVIKHISQEIDKYDKRIKSYAKNSENAKRLQQIPGVGPVISTALSYMIADPKVYKNGRQCAAALGLTPKEHSTGGKQRLGSISGEGNAYLRKILVQGAQAVLQRAGKRQNEPLLKWAYQLKINKNNNLAAVALANKITRIAWAMLVKQSDFSYKQAV
jgi:transposase